MRQEEAAYLRLYRQLREDITAGRYAYGGRLPSKRQLAWEKGVSVTTAAHALEILADEGYVTLRERSGAFVCYRRGDDFAVPPPEKSRISDTLSPVSPQAFPFSVLARTMRRVLTVYGAQIEVKTENKGLPALRQAIAAYLARSRGLVVSPAQIVIGAGAEYLYNLAIGLLGRERLFAVEDPCYDKISTVYTGNGVRFERLPLAFEGIAAEALAASRATVLRVTPYHSFPTGVTASASKRREYLAFAAARDGFVIEDDFYSEFTVSAKMEDTLFSQDKAGRVLYLNTFTATVAPALRVGYMLLPAALLAAFEEKAGAYSCTVPTFEQYVLTELLESGDFERHINRVRRRLRQEKRRT